MGTAAPPLPGVSHQPVCWNPGSHLAAQCKGAGKGGMSGPKNQGFSGFVHSGFTCTFYYAWAELGGRGKSNSLDGKSINL